MKFLITIFNVRIAKNIFLLTEFLCNIKNKKLKNSVKNEEIKILSINNNPNYNIFESTERSSNINLSSIKINNNESKNMKKIFLKMGKKINNDETKKWNENKNKLTTSKNLHLIKSEANSNYHSNMKLKENENNINFENIKNPNE